MNMNKVIRLFCVCAVMGGFSLTSCLSDGDDTIVLEQGNPTGIPDDSMADPNPEVTVPTTVIPNIQYTTEDENGFTVMRVDMTGVQNPDTYEWLRLIGTGGNKNGRQNVWIEVDGKPKGIEVYNTIDDNTDRVILNDVVFLVDNSGSMSEEADAIARDITAWAQKLSATLDVRFGCVGYDGDITGAIDITTYDKLSDYLNRATGTSRTVNFDGNNKDVLSYGASNYSNGWNECGMAALLFADNYFSFRSGANRIYVNFTDEPNQPNGKSNYSVEFLNGQTNWNTSQGTIHTVYSSYNNFTERILSEEYPWRMSEYTGGTTLYTSSSFTGVSLDDLPVTGAMQNSYIIRFTNIKEFMDGRPHEVKITVVSEDGMVRAEKIFNVVFGA